MSGALDDVADALAKIEEKVETIDAKVDALGTVRTTSNGLSSTSTARSYETIPRPVSVSESTLTISE